MKILKSIASLILATLLIFSSLGFSVNRHYCMGKMVKESFYAHSSNCCNSSSTDFNKSFNDKCCADENISIPGLPIVKISDDQTPDLTIAFYPLQNDFLTPESIHHTEKHFRPTGHSPPHHSRKIIIEIQQFLI